MTLPERITAPLITARGDALQRWQGAEASSQLDGVQKTGAIEMPIPLSMPEELVRAKVLAAQRGMSVRVGGARRVALRTATQTLPSNRCRNCTGP